MALATLSIDLVAHLAKFEGDMGKATRIAEQHATRMKSALGSVQTTLASLAGGFTVALAYDKFKGIVNGVDALNDLKDATGASIEKLSALEDVAARTNTPMEAVSTAVVKLNKVIGEARVDNEAGAALKAIGINAQELKSIDPADALVRVAKALDGVADDGNKARLVQELFGKSIREVAPLLADLAKNGELNSKVTTEQAEAAERFNHALATLQKNSLDASREIVGSLLPAFTRMLAVYNELTKLGARGTVLQYPALAFGDPGQKINDLLEKRTEVERRIAEIESGKSGSAFGGGNTKAANKARLADLREEKDLLDSGLEVLRARQRVSAVLDAAEGDTSDAISRRGQRGRVSVQFSGAAKKPGATQAEQISDARRELATYIGGLERQLSTQRELTAEQAAGLKLQSLGALGQAPQVRELVLNMAKEVDLNKANKEQLEALAKVRGLTTAAHVKHLEALATDNDRLAASNQAARDATAEIGLEADAVERLRLARLDANLARERELLLVAQNIDGNEAEVAQIERRLALLQQERAITADAATRRSAATQADAAKKIQDREAEDARQRTARISQSVADGLLNGFRAGKDFGEVFLEELKAQASKTVLQPVIEPIVRVVDQAIGELLGSFVGSLGIPGFGGARALGGPVMAGEAYLVGEHGPEVIRPNRSGTVVPNHRLAGQGGAVINQTFHYTIGDVATMKQVQAVVASSHAQAERARRDFEGRRF
jgi:hypothetical protein